MGPWASRLRSLPGLQDALDWSEKLDVLKLFSHSRGHNTETLGVSAAVSGPYNAPARASHLLSKLSLVCFAIRS